MKLSNNALNFLLAQYRAIFQRAYAKGLAPAIMLTAALAAGQAQAVNNQFVENNSGSFNSFDVVYDDKDGLSTYSGGNTWANSLNISNGYDLTINSSGTVHINTGVVVTGSGTTLTLNSLTIGASDKGAMGDSTASLKVTDGAALNVSGNQAYFDAFELNNANLTIGGKVSQPSSATSVNDSTQLLVGQDGSQSVIAGNATKISLNADSVLLFGGAANFQDGELIFNGTAGDNYSAVLEGSRSQTLTLQGTDLKVNSGKTGAILANHIEMTAGTISNSGTMLITGRNPNSDHAGGEMDGVTFQAADILMTGGTIENTGTLTIGAAKEQAFKNGVDDTVFTANGDSSIKNTGIINFYAGDITLSESNFEGLFTKGTGSEQGKVTFSGGDVDLTVSGSVDLNELGILDTDGTLSNNFTVEANKTVNLTTDSVTVDSKFDTNQLAITTGTLNFSGAATNKRFTISSGSITVHDVLNGAAATDRVVIKAENTSDSATLHLAAGANGGKVTNVDRFNVGWKAAQSTSGDSILEVDGTWDFGDARITASSKGQVIIDGTANNVSDLMMEADGHVTVNGAMTIERLLGAEKGTTGTIVLNGSLTITGDGDKTDEGSNVNNVYFNDVQLPLATVNINNGGTLAIKGEDALEDIFEVNKDKDGKVTSISVVASGSKNDTHGGWDNTKVNLNAGGTLSISVADIGLTEIGTDALRTLKDSLVNRDYQGAFNFGTGLTIKLDETLEKDIKEDGEVDYSVLKDAGINDVQNVAEGVTVVVDASTATSGINLGNNAAAVKLTGSNNALNVSGS